MFRGCGEKIAVAVLMLIAFLCGVAVSNPARQFIANLAMPGAGASFSTPAQEQSGAAAEDMIERQFGKRIPGTATNFYYGRVDDDFYWIRFDIPPSNLSGVFTGSPYMTCNFPLTDGYRPVFDAPPLNSAGTALGWWNPTSASTVVGGECSGSGPRTFMIMANAANPTLWTIYMEVRQG
jgi:hypothetical protein